MVWGLSISAGLMVFLAISSMGTVLIILGSGLLGMWLCLELSFFGFIPILNGKTVGENEAAVKYFIVQAIGSGILLMGFMLISGEHLLVGPGLMGNEMSYLIMVFGLLMKLGVFPMHFWFPSVMSSCSWFSCFWLSVVQKVGPFWGLGGFGLEGMALATVMMLLVSTSIVGAFGGLAQVQFRPLLAYSSLGQAGWMGLVVLMSAQLFLWYICLYSFILVGLMLGLNAINSYSLMQIPGWSLSKGLMFWVFSCSFFISLSGLPPLAGSALKLMGILIIINSSPIYVGVLIISSMVSLYYYLTMFIGSVVYVGGGGFSMYNSLVEGRGLGFSLMTLTGLNWVGGFPLFMVCGAFLI